MDFPIICYSVICVLIPGLHKDFPTEAEAEAFATHLRGAIASEGGDETVLCSAIVDAPPLHELLGCAPGEVDDVLDSLEPLDI